MVNWTAAQEEAIDYNDSSLLVSAAAGSGKTAVLVERIIKKLTNTQNPLQIDEILVSTFTNKAAEEMRNRIGEALQEAIEAAPNSNHLRKQLSLLQNANISTLHSFCMQIVRQYAYLIDVDPAFRISDEMEIELLRQEALDDLLEEAYQSADDSIEMIFQLADMYSNDRSDDGLGELILSLYFTANETPWPKHWLQQLNQAYQVTAETDESQLQWLNILKAEVKEDIKMMLSENGNAIELAESPEGPEQYIEALMDDKENIQALESHLTHWDTFSEKIHAFSFKGLSRKKSDCDPDLKDKVKEIRNNYKKYLESKIKPLCVRNLAGHIRDLQKLSPYVGKLITLTLRFQDIFRAKKKEKAILDFSDLEHLSLQILLDETATPEETVYSNVAEQYQAQFKEVYVDEYQDINLVQETIIQAVSQQTGPGNLFMVGDVKQSIYRFRSAEPGLFIDKYQAFKSGQANGKKIDLAQNFRSRSQILDGANFIFKQLFDIALGEIEYDKAAELAYGNKSYDDMPLEDEAVELILVEQKDLTENIESDNQNLENLLKSQLEARLYAQKIRKWLGTDNGKPMQVYDKALKKQRNITYRDIVILKRSTTSFSAIIEELKKQGIPAYAELKTGYFDAIEIQVMLSLLKIIDNPHQDIPLAAVLRSPIVGLSEEELARIRIKKKNVSFYKALQSYMVEHSPDRADQIDKDLYLKLKQFHQQLDNFRALANETTLSEVIWTIFLETGYYDFVGGIPGGRQRQANLRALYDRARSYEKSSFRGLYRFLRFIEKLEEERKDLGAARALSEEEDVVRIMTIHKSKGLEFPVVILGSIEHQFNQQDVRKKYLLSKDLNFATKYIDADKQIMYPTLYFEAAKKVELKKALAEEMRVLYVALTRAKEKLVMVGTVKDYEKTIKKWQQVLEHEHWVLPLSIRKQSLSYLDWLGPALMRHHEAKPLHDESSTIRPQMGIYDDPSRWHIEIVPKEKLILKSPQHEKVEEKLEESIAAWENNGVFGQDIDSEVEKRLSFKYKYKKATETRAKESVTEIKRRLEQLEMHSSHGLLPRFSNLSEVRPKFLMKEKVLTAAEIGTATHAVMQYLPMEKPLNLTEIKTYVDNYVADEKLRQEEADEIDLAAIESFMNSGFAHEYLYKHKLEKEVPFTYMLPVAKAYPDWSESNEEKLLIQGIVDCIIQTEEGLIILDYKTDHIAGEVTEEMRVKLEEKYRVQMELYKLALENIYKTKILDVYLYYFSKDILVKMNNV